MATEYRQKPPIVEALQYDGSNAEEMIAFCPQIKTINDKLVFAGIEVKEGHWISKDAGGMFYPQGDTFLVYYEINPSE